MISRLSGQTEILRRFHFPFSIIPMSFVIAGTGRRAAITNDIGIMENGKLAGARAASRL
jgi:hypothetical protein